MAKRPLPALTGIRFCLALWVVFYHYGPPMEQIPSVGDAFRSIQHTGYAAVTAFFVLSGFVLAYNYNLDRPFSSAARWRFGAARFSRIYPAYICGLLLMLPFAFYRLLAGIHLDPPFVEWGGFVLNVLLLQAWLPHTALSWNYPGWSLSSEAFFYLCFPFLGSLFRSIRRPAALCTAFVICWFLACLGPLIAMWTHTYHWWDLPATTNPPLDASLWATVVRYNPLVRLPEFCAGILLAKLYALIPDSFHERGMWIYSPAIVLTVLCLIEAHHFPYPLFHNGLLLPLFSAIILGLALGGGQPARWLSTPAMLLLGNASYSLYILHAPLALWCALLFRFLLRLPNSGWLWSCSYIAFVVVASCVFFKFIEEPTHRSLRKKLDALVHERL